MSEILQKGKLAKNASYALGNLSTKEKDEALLLIAKQLIIDEQAILDANKKDIEAGKNSGLTDAVLDRVLLTKERIKGISDAVRSLIDLKDPVGEVIESIKHDNGMTIEKVRVPIGVVGIIYEARPNVTIDAATLALKAGNAVVLRGSSQAIHSNKALVRSLYRALEESSVPVDAVQLIEDTDRDKAKEFFTLKEYLDVLIPRGSAALIQTVIKEATVPVIETGAGNCHIYIDETADKNMAIEIVKNAKIQRPSVCNAVESVLIDPVWFEDYGLDLLRELSSHNVLIHGDPEVKKVFPDAQLATEESYEREYLDLELSVKLIDTVVDAIEHINHYGTGHSESIITENKAHAKQFLQNVDASSVYHNVSTRFTDGGEFGYGAELGISTQKLHARGPMGLKTLTTGKFIIQGNGQIRD